MVLDSGTQSYERHRSVLSASPQRERDGKKFSEHNGLRLYPYLSPSPSPDSDPAHLGQRPKMLTKLKCSKASEARSEIRRQSETCSSFSSPCSWMRRSESTSTVNSSGRARAQIRSAASLPHIARPKSEEISRRSPCLLVALRPLNVDEEREKFFQSCYTYNPQFEYEEPVPTAVLEKYRDASDQFITQATGIIHAVLEKYGSYENFEVATGGRLLSKCQIWSIIRKYMQKEGCVGEIPPFTHPRFPLALSAPLGTPGRHAGGEASVARGGCAPESPSAIQNHPGLTQDLQQCPGLVAVSRLLTQQRCEQQRLGIRQGKRPARRGSCECQDSRCAPGPAPPCTRPAEDGAFVEGLTMEIHRLMRKRHVQCPLLSRYGVCLGRGAGCQLGRNAG
ncbi:microtubule-associated tyrosine carboxypeptidase 1 isoform X3 [Pelodiscus sinensis]|uniref:microtubule-associated tyrosine carboxypeptidase 1 isoform X3 n=1 Tax=Pelodiscus sinensis TaxID=13735 RepID=UPI003F6BAA07